MGLQGAQPPPGEPDGYVDGSKGEVAAGAREAGQEWDPVTGRQGGQQPPVPGETANDGGLEEGADSHLG